MQSLPLVLHSAFVVQVIQCSSCFLSGNTEVQLFWKNLFHLVNIILSYNGFSSGLKVSDESIRAGLEHTYLLGRSQFLTPEEASQLGLPGATILLDGGRASPVNGEKRI